MPEIIIGGDVCPTASDAHLFENADREALLQTLSPVFAEADLRVVDLECPLIARSAPILKKGPILGATVSCAAGLRALGVDAVNLANNHILDHGPSGIDSTLRALEKNGVAYFGAGRDRESAGRAWIATPGDVRVAFLGTAEHEFSIAAENSWGACPLDLVDLVHALHAARDEADHVVLLLHGGNEHFPYPSPRLQKTARFLVEQGADAVLCQHTHCAGCYERWAGGWIVYGQGNLIFDDPRGGDEWYKGFLVHLSLGAGPESALRITPYVQSRERPGVRLMTGSEDGEFREEVEARSQLLADPEALRDVWMQFCSDKRNYYTNILFRAGPAMRWLSRNNALPGWIMSRRRLLAMENTIRCEAHREVVETLFDEFL